jgi:hypothetical protein
MGLLQRSLLDYYINQSLLWVVASCLAGLVGFGFIIVLQTKVSLPILWALYGAIYGLITGVCLTLMYIKTMNKSVAV